MKKFCVALSALFFGLSLSAQEEDKRSILERLDWNDKMLNIMLDTRVDFQSTFNAGDNDRLGFYGQTIKLLLVGEIVPGVRYRLRHRFNKSQMPLREGYSSATDQAWLAFDIGKHWTITAGKQSVQYGTFEYDVNAADVYLATMCYSDLDSYKAGVNVAYKFLGQTMNVQVINSDPVQYASERYKNKALAVNLLWQGSLFNDLIKTRWGYSAFQHDAKKFYNWFTLGTQVNVGKFSTDLDYYTGSRNLDYGSTVQNTELGTRYVQDQSAAINLRYNFGKWRPQLKGVWNKRFDKELDKTAYQVAGVQAAMEFYPFEGALKDLRFHAMYAYTSTHYKGVYSDLDNVNASSILGGVRWLFKVK